MEEKIKPRNTVFAVITVQAISTALILLSVFCLKSFYKKGYEKLTAFYSENFEKGTDLKEFFEYFKE